MEETENKYCLKLRSNFMRYADQVIGNGNHATYAEGCFKNGKPWRVEHHTSRYWLFIDDYLYKKETIDEDFLDYQPSRTTPGIFYKYANRLLDWYAEKYETEVDVPVDCAKPKTT